MWRKDPGSEKASMKVREHALKLVGARLEVHFAPAKSRPFVVLGCLRLNVIEPPALQPFYITLSTRQFRNI